MVLEEYTCFRLTSKWKKGAPRKSVSQSFVVQLSTGPIESGSDSGTWELHRIDWERPDIKAGLGFVVIGRKETFLTLEVLSFCLEV